MSRRQWVDVEVDLPSAASVETMVNDAASLTLLCDVLRAAVVQVEDLRARLAEERA